MRLPRRPTVAFLVGASLAVPVPSFAQQSVTGILSFLLTNRSIGTDDPARDEAAAAATRDTISRFLRLELSTLPTLSSSAGFTYRIDNELGGMVVRSSDSFGPSFVERSLTAGRFQPAFGLSYQDISYDALDDRPLTDGTLVATAARLAGQPDPFDVETLTLRLRTRSVTLSANVGVTDRLDVSAVVPMMRLTLDGERTDTLRGVSFLQASARADSSGLGDIAIRTKFNVVRRGGTGVAAGAELRLPTGSAEDLLGAGEASFKPRVIGSFEHEWIAAHSELGYMFGGLSRELDYGGAVTMVASPRVTVIGELVGRRLASGGRIVETVERHPTLVGIETIRLTGVPEATHRLTAVGGVKWNVANTWLVSASLQRTLTSAGLTADFIPSLAVEYAFSR